MDTRRLTADDGLVKHSLWASKSFVVNFDFLTVRKVEGFFKSWRGSSCSNLLFEVKSNITLFFF